MGFNMPFSSSEASSSANDDLPCSIRCAYGSRAFLDRSSNNGMSMFFTESADISASPSEPVAIALI